ncbi:hypothetical protein EVAR_24168_1 [Eumeta japonica]|uniref:Uncharacterized protein n=1 Tax=Eumeta variegata TaxID=151549 RepID=A0A4C1W758_EUMVA|nr:hypothetical protein EVAR_24168_1 [Eumeta japonica]
MGDLDFHAPRLAAPRRAGVTRICTASVHRDDIEIFLRTYTNPTNTFSSTHKGSDYVLRLCPYKRSLKHVEGVRRAGAHLRPPDFVLMPGRTARKAGTLNRIIPLSTPRITEIHGARAAPAPRRPFRAVAPVTRPAAAPRPGARKRDRIQFIRRTHEKRSGVYFERVRHVTRRHNIPRGPTTVHINDITNDRDWNRDRNESGVGIEKEDGTRITGADGDANGTDQTQRHKLNTENETVKAQGNAAGGAGGGRGFRQSRRGRRQEATVSGGYCAPAIVSVATRRHSKRRHTNNPVYPAPIDVLHQKYMCYTQHNLEALWRDGRTRRTKCCTRVASVIVRVGGFIGADGRGAGGGAGGGAGRVGEAPTLINERSL